MNQENCMPSNFANIKLNSHFQTCLPTNSATHVYLPQQNFMNVAVGAGFVTDSFDYTGQPFLKSFQPPDYSAMSSTASTVSTGLSLMTSAPPRTQSTPLPTRKFSVKVSDETSRFLLWSILFSQIPHHYFTKIINPLITVIVGKYLEIKRLLGY